MLPVIGNMQVPVVAITGCATSRLGTAATVTVEVLEDTDADGLTDVEEEIAGTNPHDADTDDDGVAS